MFLTKCTGRLISSLLLTSCCFASHSLAANHGIAMHGDLKYSEDFKHFDYVNPAAPKGGEMKRWSMGTFDSFNGFIIKGSTPAGLDKIYDSLLAKSLDEPFSMYGLLAEEIDLPDNRQYITFKLNPKAKFSDGHPLDTQDVKFTFETLLSKGTPFYRAYLGDIGRIEVKDKQTVTFHIKNNNRELPLIIGEIPILPEHYWKDRDFTSPSLDTPIGSGPYVIKDFEPGRSITYQRDPNYWGLNLPVNIGKNNFDTLVYDFYRDNTVSLEAFKAGEYDFRLETSSKEWANSYSGEQFDSGNFIAQEIPHSLPTGMQAFVFNTRKPIFQDKLVRQALAYAFDFEWTNANLFYNAYARTHSYFSNSDMAADTLPNEQELALLEPYRDQLPTEVFSQVFKAPSYKGDGKIRKELRQALRLLKSAGWELKKGKLLNKSTQQPMRFEILLAQKNFERIVAPMLKNFKRMGIEVSVRTVDVSQYINRIREFDFDMLIYTYGQSSSPGNEQREFWGSYNADKPGSRNLIGIKNPVVDALIEKVIQAPDRPSLVAATRALDRVLQWNYYLIPQFHGRTYRIAYKNIFGFPEEHPKYDLGLETWWYKGPAK